MLCTQPMSRAGPVKIIFLMSDPSRLHHRGDLRRGSRGRIPFDPALRRDAGATSELVPIGVNHRVDRTKLLPTAPLNITSVVRRPAPKSPIGRSTGQLIPAALAVGKEAVSRRSDVRGHVRPRRVGIAGRRPGRRQRPQDARPSQRRTTAHGGPIDRFHTAGSCDLTAVSSLPGNWTHGDYVSAVAANGNAAQIREAAHSDCGKPRVAVGHGGGPPEHALEHMAGGKAHAGGKADEGSETSGS
jgi:hypothetical protein